MDVKVKSRSGREMGTFSIEDTTTVDEFKAIFYQQHKGLEPNRQWFTINEPRGTALKDGKALMVKEVQKQDTLIFKDLGLQMSWRLVYIIEYFGPVLLFPLFYFCDELIYGVKAEKCWEQKIAFFMLMFHYTKRELESAFVHRFSTDTMPWIRVIYNSAFYWGLSGFLVGYWLFHPQYTPAAHLPDVVKMALIATFFTCECMNGVCHQVLKNLRPAGTRVRGIPKGFGFGLVSCANYFYEVINWLSFALLVNTFGAYFFIVTTIYVLSGWAMTRHRRYKKEFDGQEGRELYPKSRKALIPFIY